VAVELTATNAPEKKAEDLSQTGCGILPTITPAVRQRYLLPLMH
jgi:hypothetical protein